MTDSEHGDGTPKTSSHVARVHIGILIALTFATGLVDALSWIGLDGVFTANMTGNVLIVGMGMAGAGGAHWLPPLASLTAFLIGAALTGFLQRNDPPGWTLRTRVQFGVTTATLLIVGVVTLIAPPQRLELWASVVMIALSFAMGVQGATAMRLAVSEITTVAVSSTVLGVGMGLFLGVGHWRKIGMLHRVLAIVALALGAFVGSLLITISFAVGLIVAGAIGFGCAIVAYRYRHDRRREDGPVQS